MATHPLRFHHQQGRTLRGRITASTARRYSPVLVCGYGCATFLFPWFGLPLLKWKKMADFHVGDYRVSAWRGRFSDSREWMAQWSAVESTIVELYGFFLKTDLSPNSLTTHIYYPLIFSGFRIRRGLVIDFWLKDGMVRDFLDIFRPIAEKLGDDLIKLHN